MYFEILSLPNSSNSKYEITTWPALLSITSRLHSVLQFGSDVHKDILIKNPSGFAFQGNYHLHNNVLCLSKKLQTGAEKRKKMPVLQGHLYMKTGSEIIYKDYNYYKYCVFSWKIWFIKLLFNSDDLIGNLTLWPENDILQSFHFHANEKRI